MDEWWFDELEVEEAGGGVVVWGGDVVLEDLVALVICGVHLPISKKTLKHDFLNFQNTLTICS
jgi:hypothetical protein